MDLFHCPDCRTVRTYHNGKCMTCGYISRTREAVNYLYGLKSVVKSSSNQRSSAVRMPGNNQFDSFCTAAVETSASFSDGNCSDSSNGSSDSGSSGCE